MSITAQTHNRLVEVDACAASEGDLDALGRLYEEYADRLYHWLITRVRNHNVALAEDIAGATWLKVAERIQTYAGRSSFYTWLMTIARNEMRDRAGAAATRHEHLAPAMLNGEVWIDRTDPNPGPEACSLASEARTVIAAAIEELPTNQRRAVILHHWVGLTLAETAVTMKKTPDSVAGLHQRALRTLKPTLAHYVHQMPAGTMAASMLEETT